MYYKSVEEFCQDWGYSPTLGLINEIKSIFDLIMDNGLNIVENKIVVSDDVYEQIRAIEIHKLKKKVTAWARKKDSKFYFNGIITQKASDYEQKIKRENEIKEQAKRQKRAEEQGEMLLFLEEQKKKFKEWKDSKWINDNIGVYCTETPMLEYYWSIIGKRYKKANWKGDLLIEKNVYDQIAEIKNKWLAGKTFLGRSFSRGGYSHKIVGTYGRANVNGPCGIYGIYKNGKLIYIGKTERLFQLRWQEHKDIIAGKEPKPQGMTLYDLISEDDLIEFEVLVDVTKVQVEGGLTSRDVQSMELGLISYFRPIGNIQGIRSDYRYE